jgi:hypothetical protein
MAWELYGPGPDMVEWTTSLPRLYRRWREIERESQMQTSLRLPPAGTSDSRMDITVQSELPEGEAGRLVIATPSARDKPSAPSAAALLDG